MPCAANQQLLLMGQAAAGSCAHALATLHASLLAPTLTSWMPSFLCPQLKRMFEDLKPAFPQLLRSRRRCAGQAAAS